MNYEMIKYNIVVCCYGKILVNVAIYVIPGYVYVVYWSEVLFLIYALLMILPERNYAASSISKLCLLSLSCCNFC